jgi:hypothetical protein
MIVILAYRKRKCKNDYMKEFKIEDIYTNEEVEVRIISKKRKNVSAIRFFFDTIPVKIKYNDQTVTLTHTTKISFNKMKYNTYSFINCINNTYFYSDGYVLNNVNMNEYDENEYLFNSIKYFSDLNDKTNITEILKQCKIRIKAKFYEEFTLNDLIIIACSIPVLLALLILPLYVLGIIKIKKKR